jgi:HEAT repeat protein
LAVENLKSDRDIAGLIRLLEDEDHGIREQALIALGEIGDVSCVLPIAQRLQDDYLANRIAARNALIQIGNQAVDPLLEVLKDQNPLVREGAVQTLEKIGDPRVIPQLIEAFKNTTRKRIADALKSMGSASFEPLMEALKNDDPRIRVGAVLALSEMKNPAALEALTKMEKDKDILVRQFASGAVHRIKRETSLKKRRL